MSKYIFDGTQWDEFMLNINEGMQETAHVNPEAFFSFHENLVEHLNSVDHTFESFIGYPRDFKIYEQVDIPEIVEFAEGVEGNQAMRAAIRKENQDIVRGNAMVRLSMGAMSQVLKKLVAPSIFRVLQSAHPQAQFVRYWYTLVATYGETAGRIKDIHDEPWAIVEKLK